MDIRLIWELFAETAMFSLEHAGRLKSGLKRITKGGIDAILLDLGLPDSQGFDTFTRTYSKVQKIPIVLLPVKQGGKDFKKCLLKNIFRRQ